MADLRPSKPFKTRFLIYVTLAMLIFDLIYLSPGLNLNFFLVSREILLDRSSNLIGSDFTFYFRAGSDSLLGFEVNSIEYLDVNSGMLWLYPPPLLEVFKLDIVNHHPKIFLALALGLLFFHIHHVSLALQRACSTNFNFDKPALSSVYIIAFIGWPVFFTVTISNLNLGSILISFAATCLIVESPKWWLYRTIVCVLVFIKPQYFLFLFVKSLSSFKLHEGDLKALLSVMALHFLAFVLYTKDYLAWIEVVTRYALYSQHNGLWLLSLITSENLLKQLLAGICFLMIASVAYTIKTISFRAPREAHILGFCVLYFCVPRIYEYEIFLLPIFVALFVVMRSDNIGAFACIVLLLAGLLYRATSILAGGNYYSPSGSQFFLIGCLLILLRHCYFQPTNEESGR